MCGKSGSAQVIGSEGLAKAKNRAEFKDNAWFVGFAPRRNPEIVVAALVQSTMKHGGEIAAPIARDVVKAYYDKKNKKNGQQLTAVNTPPASLSTIPAQRPLQSKPQSSTPQPKTTAFRAATGCAAAIKESETEPENQRISQDERRVER